MTNPSEVTISDAEISAIYKFCDDMDAQENAPKPREIFRQALAAFLAARVPGALPAMQNEHWETQRAVGHNACRDDVLLAAKVKK
jgi:hypothetical protein